MTIKPLNAAVRPTPVLVSVLMSNPSDVLGVLQNRTSVIATGGLLYSASDTASFAGGYIMNGGMDELVTELKRLEKLGYVPPAGYELDYLPTSATVTMNWGEAYSIVQVCVSLIPSYTYQPAMAAFSYPRGLSTQTTSPAISCVYLIACLLVPLHCRALNLCSSHAKRPTPAFRTGGPRRRAFMTK